MKKLMISIAVVSCLLLAGSAWAVDLAWDANTDSAIGYKLYYQQTGTTETNSELILGRETVLYTVENSKFIPGEEYSFWLTAYNDMAESGPSNVVTWTAPEFIPTENPGPVIINIPGNPGPVTINIGG